MDLKDEARLIYRTLGPFISINDIVLEGIIYHNAKLNWTAFEERFEGS